MIFGVVYHTDKGWLNFLEANYSGGEVNFYTSRKNRINAPDNIPFFFKTEDSRIVGMAELVRKEYLTIDQMWDKYHRMNGEENIDAVKQWYRFRRGWSYSTDKKRCMILKDFVIFEKYVDLLQIFPKLFNASKYIRDKKIVAKIMTLAGLTPGTSTDLNPEAVKPRFRPTLVNSRLFQGPLRDRALECYGNKCLICGIDIQDLLWVSHIKPVAKFPEEAGKIGNTLILCRLHDGMFDRGLISIGDDSGIIISHILRESRSEKVRREVGELENERIAANLDDCREFLRWHVNNVLRKK